MYTIIYSPVAGAGRGERNALILAKHLEERGIKHRLIRAEYEGHPEVLAREAAEQGCEVVIAAGGDGTVNEVARGLLGTQTAMGILPAGTGNDFRRTFNIPDDPIEAMDRILQNNRIQVDVGIINDKHIFLNEVGTGFDVSMDHHLVRLKKKIKGKACFLLAVLMTIAEYPFPRIRIQVDGGEPIDAQPMLVTVANGREFGSGMKLAPHACPQDGLLDVMVVHRIARWRIPFLLPKLVDGRLATKGYGFVQTWQAKDVLIEGSDMSMQVDGTIFPVGGEARVALHAHKLWLMA